MQCNKNPAKLFDSFAPNARQMPEKNKMTIIKHQEKNQKKETKRRKANSQNIKGYLIENTNWTKSRTTMLVKQIPKLKTHSCKAQQLPTKELLNPNTDNPATRPRSPASRPS